MIVANDATVRYGTYDSPWPYYSPLRPDTKYNREKQDVIMVVVRLTLTPPLTTALHTTALLLTIVAVRTMALLLTMALRTMPLLTCRCGAAPTTRSP